MSRIFWTKAAKQDLLDIWLWVAERNEKAADRIQDDIAERLRLTLDFPDAGALAPEAGPDARRLVVKPYIVLYSAESGGVRVVRVVHGRRDLAQAIRQGR